MEIVILLSRFSLSLLSFLSGQIPNAPERRERQSEMLRRMAMDLERVRKQRVPVGRLIGKGRTVREMGTFLEKFHGGKRRRVNVQVNILICDI